MWDNSFCHAEEKNRWHLRRQICWILSTRVKAGAWQVVIEIEVCFSVTCTPWRSQKLSSSQIARVSLAIGSRRHSTREATTLTSRRRTSRKLQRDIAGEGWGEDRENYCLEGINPRRWVNPFTEGIRWVGHAIKRMLAVDSVFHRRTNRHQLRREIFRYAMMPRASPEILFMAHFVIVFGVYAGLQRPRMHL